MCIREGTERNGKTSPKRGLVVEDDRGGELGGDRIAGGSRLRPRRLV